MDVYFVGGGYASPEDRAKFSPATMQVSPEVMSPEDGTAPFNASYMGYMTLPGFSLGGMGTTLVTSGSEFHIVDRHVFDLFAVTMVNAQNITWYLKARNGITIAPSGLGLFGYHVSDVPFAKRSTMKAQGGLQNVTLEVFNLKDSTPTQAVIEMVANVQNPSCTSITPLGDLSFDVVFGGALMGTLHAKRIDLGEFWKKWEESGSKRETRD